MKTPRLLVLALATLAFSPATPALAQDPAIAGQLSKIRNALPNQQYPQPDFKSLNTAAQSLLKKTPVALTPPATFELNSPEPSDAQAPLDLSDDQRAGLLEAYQFYTGRIARLARTNPFTRATADDIAGLHRSLQTFMTGLERLGKMDPTSPAYHTLIRQLIANAAPKPAPKPKSGSAGGQR